MQFSHADDKVSAPSHANWNIVLSALRYYWITARGYRLRPWQSPYLRWRMETFFGPQAEPLTAGHFLSLLWRERRRMREFVQWADSARKRSAQS